MVFKPKLLFIQLFSSAAAADTAPSDETVAAPGISAPLETECQLPGKNSITTVAEGCVNCNLCVNNCLFLENRGTPGKICQQSHAGASGQPPVFECTLCGLCESTCPKYLPITSAFLDIRRNVQQHGGQTPAVTPVDRRHNRICSYEKMGTSRFLSLHHLPEGGDTVFFPGCTLAASRADVTLKTFEHLRKRDSRCGIILDCCSKPSHDLGLTGRFEQSFKRLAAKLRAKGVKHIITACPSCYVTFRQYLPECSTRTIYEELARHPPSMNGSLNETVTIHDTCTCRGESQIHHSVRTLVQATGAKTAEADHCRGTSLCCGEGAAAAYIAPDFSAHWRAMRKNEAAGRRVITYCAGCASTLAKAVSTTHLLDLLFDTTRAVSGEERRTGAPWTWLRRLQLKWKLLYRQKMGRI